MDVRSIIMPLITTTTTTDNNNNNIEKFNLIKIVEKKKSSIIVFTRATRDLQVQQTSSSHESFNVHIRKHSFYHFHVFVL